MKATTVGNLDRSNKDNGMKEKDHVNLSSDLLLATCNSWSVHATGQVINRRREWLPDVTCLCLLFL